MFFCFSVWFLLNTDTGLSDTCFHASCPVNNSSMRRGCGRPWTRAPAVYFVLILFCGVFFFHPWQNVLFSVSLHGKTKTAWHMNNVQIYQGYESTLINSSKPTNTPQFPLLEEVRWSHVVLLAPSFSWHRKPYLPFYWLFNKSGLPLHLHLKVKRPSFAAADEPSKPETLWV